MGNNVGDKVKDKVQTKRETKRGNKCETDWETKWGTKGAKWELGSAKVMALTSPTSWEQRMVQLWATNVQTETASGCQNASTRSNFGQSNASECRWQRMHAGHYAHTTHSESLRATHSMNSYELDKCP